MGNPATDLTRGQLTRAVRLLQGHVHFDAALLIHQPEGARSRIVSRVGYSAGSAWALQHLFPRDYEVGFTSRLNPADGLPLSISDVGGTVREEFTRTVLFEQYLRAEGFADGMTVELFDGGDYVGLAHFSARRPDAFAAPQRALARDLSGLLALALRPDQVTEDIRRAPSAGPTGSATPAPSTVYVRRGARTRSAGPVDVPFVAEAAFVHVMDDVVACGVGELRHLWWHQGSWYRVTLSPLGDFGDLRVTAWPVTAEQVWHLSRQEVRVLSGLMVGRTDAAIAAGLDLSPRTVHTHMVNIRRKLGVDRRTEAAARATATATVIPGPATAPVTELARIYRDSFP
ncbi:helix-turn-helix transcriptional regulator [Gordonia lacunae]|uniref:Helix-turn-helix transcriptional regulator n=1 Tax=Gordonia lacunae TaxID=417102 RepID=A0A243QD53_9ACTN|nr:helix-turn-helix transcriptional regulator [Gordonia lacunae]OUC79689.1 helix-turn-helix transcriptional regulator [Gordonia lacunae]